MSKHTVSIQRCTWPIECVIMNTKYYMDIIEYNGIFTPLCNSVSSVNAYIHSDNRIQYVGRSTYTQFHYMKEEHNNIE